MPQSDSMLYVSRSRATRGNDAAEPFDAVARLYLKIPNLKNAWVNGRT